VAFERSQMEAGAAASSPRPREACACCTSGTGTGNIPSVRCGEKLRICHLPRVAFDALQRGVLEWRRWLLALLL
jgi:hypothetical protein